MTEFPLPAKGFPTSSRTTSRETVSESTADIATFEDQFLYDLRAVYDMELKLVGALDEMSRLVTDDNLEKGFAIHANETENQAERVEAAFAGLGREPERRENLVTDGLLADRERFDELVTDEGVRNVRYLEVATKTERIEITSYEGLLRTAEKANLGEEVIGPLKDNLKEEEKTLRKLEGLAGGTDLKALWNELTGP